MLPHVQEDVDRLIGDELPGEAGVIVTRTGSALKVRRTNAFVFLLVANARRGQPHTGADETHGERGKAGACSRPVPLRPLNLQLSRHTKADPERVAECLPRPCAISSSCISSSSFILLHPNLDLAPWTASLHPTGVGPGARGHLLVYSICQFYAVCHIFCPFFIV